MFGSHPSLKISERNRRKPFRALVATTEHAPLSITPRTSLIEVMKGSFPRCAIDVGGLVMHSMHVIERREGPIHCTSSMQHCLGQVLLTP